MEVLMQRLIVFFFAGVLLLAVLSVAGFHRDAGAAAPGDGGLSSSLCAGASAVGPVGTAGPAAPEADAGRILLACQFQKPQNGCKKNPCDGKTYCCVNSNCKVM